MLTVEYTREGTPVNDFTYINWVYKVLHYKNSDKVFCVSTSIAITAVRLEIVKGNLDCSKVVFKFGDKLLYANEYGAITNWPQGFCDTETRLCEEILRLAMAKKKTEVNKIDTDSL
jgi:hypothetical protein